MILLAALLHVGNLVTQPYWGTVPFAVSPNGRVLAIVQHRSSAPYDPQVGGANPHEDDWVHFYDTANGASLGELESNPSAIEFSPDGSLLALGGRNLTVIDVVTKRVRWTVAGVRVNVLSFTADGSAIVAGGAQPLVGVYDARDGSERWAQRHGSIVLSVAVDPSNKLIVSGSDAGGIRVWDFETGREVRRLVESGFETSKTRPGRIMALAFLNSSELVSGGGNGNAIWWNPATGEELHRMVCEDYVASIALARGGVMALACNQSGPLLVRASKFRAIAALSDGAWGTRKVAAAPGGWWVAGGDDTLKFYADGASHARTVSGRIRAAAFSGDRKWLAYSLGDQDVHVRRTGAQQDARVLHGLTSSSQPADWGFRPGVALAVDSSGDVAGSTYFTSGSDVAGAYDPHVVVWDRYGREAWSSRSLLASDLLFARHGDVLLAKSPGVWLTPWYVTAVDLRAHAIRTLNFEKDCYEHDVQAGGGYRICGFTTAALSAAIAPSAVVAIRSAVRQIAVPSGKMLRSFPGAGMSPDGVALSPDGETVLLSGNDFVAWQYQNRPVVRIGVRSPYGFTVGGGNRAIAILDGHAYTTDGWRLSLYSTLHSGPPARAEIPAANDLTFGPCGLWTSPRGNGAYVAFPNGVEDWEISPE